MTKENSLNFGMDSLQDSTDVEEAIKTEISEIPLSGQNLDSDKSGYQKTELGLIPNDWKSYMFEDVISGFSSGATPYRGKPEYYKGNIRWITSGELNYNIITDTEEKITQQAAINTNLKLLPEGTFLIAITGLEAEGTRGSCGIVGKEATTNQSCMALFPKEGLLTTEYLYHFYVRYGNELAFRYSSHLNFR